MADLSANVPEFFLERGGPFYRLQQRIGLIRGDDPSNGRRVLFFIALTWVPLLLLSLLQGRASGRRRESPFFWISPITRASLSPCRC